MSLSLQLPGSSVVILCAWFWLCRSKSGITWDSSLGRECWKRKYDCIHKTFGMYTNWDTEMEIQLHFNKHYAMALHLFMLGWAWILEVL